MNIYLISRRNLQCGYDEMKGFVVVAESLSKVRGFAAENAGREGTKFWWHNRTSVGYCIV